MLTGSMPIVGGSRFGVRPAREEFRLPVINVMVQGINPCATLNRTAPPPKQAGCYAPLSATKKPLAVGDCVRGSDNTKNRIVSPYFRGTIVEFIPTTEEGNNVRVKCSNTGKVYRVKNTEIRHVR